jgi:hypothetical protein
VLQKRDPVPWDDQILKSRPIREMGRDGKNSRDPIGHSTGQPATHLNEKTRKRAGNGYSFAKQWVLKDLIHNWLGLRSRVSNRSATVQSVR